MISTRLYIGDITMFRNDCGIEGLVLLTDEDIESAKNLTLNRTMYKGGDEILVVVDTSEIVGHTWIPCQICNGFLTFPKEIIEKKRIYRSMEEIEADDNLKDCEVI